MKRLLHRIGHRGAFLLFLAVLDVLFGYALLQPHVILFRTILSSTEWSALWLGTGTICLIQAFMKWDRIAFTLAIGLKTAWGMLMLHWWLVQHQPLGWISIIIWWSFAAVIGVVASWPEPVNWVDPEPPDLSIFRDPA